MLIKKTIDGVDSYHNITHARYYDIMNQLMEYYGTNKDYNGTIHFRRSLIRYKYKHHMIKPSILNNNFHEELSPFTIW